MRLLVLTFAWASVASAHGGPGPTGKEKTRSRTAQKKRTAHDEHANDKKNIRATNNGSQTTQATTTRRISNAHTKNKKKSKERC